MLRQIEVEIANGNTTPQASRKPKSPYGLLPLAEGIRRPEAASSETTERTGGGEHKTQAAGGRSFSGEANSEGRGGGKLLSSERRRCAVEHVRAKYQVSERNACRLLGQWRGTQRYEPIQRIDEDALTGAIIALATKYGRYGYRRIAALLRMAGRWARIGCSASGAARGCRR